MVKAINEAPKRHKGLGFERVCNLLLEKEVKVVEDSLKPIRDLWAEIGVSIISYGSKDARNWLFASYR